MRMSMWICEYCIQELRSRGEEVYVGNLSDSNKCCWCDEEDVDTYYVTMSD